MNIQNHASKDSCFPSIEVQHKWEKKRKGGKEQGRERECVCERDGQKEIGGERGRESERGKDESESANNLL